MVVGYHLIWTAYGTWLPNDPRGSSSREIACDVLKQLGELHHGRKRIQPASVEIARFYDRARPLLKHDVQLFSKTELNAIGNAFSNVIDQKTYTCYACAIMPDHVHVVIRKHRDQSEQMIEFLQDASRDAVLSLGERPANHPVWGGCGWKVFLENRDDYERTIRYVADNPLKARIAAQHWPFVKLYDGWLPGIVTKVRPALRNRKR